MYDAEKTSWLNAVDEYSRKIAALIIAQHIKFL
jgi:hypothetical protein